MGGAGVGGTHRVCDTEQGSRPFRKKDQVRQSFLGKGVCGLGL